MSAKTLGLDMPCSLCGAKPGEPCVSDRGRTREYAHKVRWKAKPYGPNHPMTVWPETARHLWERHQIEMSGEVWEFVAEVAGISQQEQDAVAAAWAEDDEDAAAQQPPASGKE